MPRGSKAQKEAKRRVVAKGIVAGKSTAAIAREAKTGKRHVERLATEPETQLLITDLMKPHRKKLEGLLKKSVEAVEAALKANRTDMADHRARMYGVRRTKDLLEMAEGKRDGDDAPIRKFSGTMEELLVLYRKVTAGKPPAGTP